MKKHLPLVARFLLGFVFFASGLAGLLNLAPPPENLPENMKTFMNGMMVTGYFIPFLKGTELLCGALLLSGYYVPLALIVLAPILINILLVHAFMAPEGLILGLILSVLEVYLAFFAQPYRSIILQIFRCPKCEGSCKAK